MARQRRPFDAVQLTLESAQRVASVVRSAEDASPPTAPLRFGNRFQQPQHDPRHVRRATFSGAWEIGATKVVTFVQAPTATANAINLTWPLTDPSSSGTCLVGKEGTNWWLIVPSLSVINCNARATSGQLSFFSS